MKEYIINKSDINSFYKNLNETNFNQVNKKKLFILKLISSKLNHFYNAKIEFTSKSEEYFKLMNRIKTNPKGYGVETEADKFILFMFSVDPTYELFKIWGESNTIKEFKDKSLTKFGVVDKKLLYLEKFFIKYFLSQEKQNEIYEEVNNRAFSIIKKK